MSRRLRISILGCTGSIGRQALDVIDRYPERFEVFGLASGSRAPDRPARYVVRSDEAGAEAAIAEMVTHPDCDLVLVAISGAQALAPTLAAIDAGKAVALATKEVLVMAGELVMARASKGQLRPVDSEHSAIWQCLWGESAASVKRLILTASGGPFWARPGLDLDQVSPEDALKHPRWTMGPKITIDSATLMNKGLELIEAHHLFEVALDRVQVLVHPQSIVHSLVEFTDGCIKAQLGNPDMRLPIGLALAFPDRLPGLAATTHLEQSGPLEFHPLDGRRFPAIEMAREAARLGPPLPAVLNAANEEAVRAFLEGRIRFGSLLPLVSDALAAFSGRGGDLEAILQADGWAREYIRGQSG